jgi:urease accessory protein
LTAPANTGWLARLRLEYACADGRTALAQRTHIGPLAVQKPFYPEGPAVCHTLILHPPGGIVGNDTLDIEVKLKEGSQVLVTMPGAGKWYRSQGAAATQRLSIDVGPDAMLEWLPPETILFNGAAAKLRTVIELAAGGDYLGWDILCLGRTASGEKFDAGEIHQSTDISIAGAPIWGERCRLRGGSPLLESPVGLAGAPVSAVMLAAGKSIPAELLAQCRAVKPETRARTGISAMPNILVARYVGDSSEQAKRYFVALWQVLRPFVGGRAAVPPRIWNT